MSAKLQKIDDYRWMVPQNYKPGMRVPGIIFADVQLLKDIEGDESVEQVANAATLPGIVKASMAMPDIHSGYGLPIGGMVATDVKTGVISPGGVGYDINCGVRLIRSHLEREAVRPLMKDLVWALFDQVPTGVGSRGKIKLNSQTEIELLTKGARWAVAAGYGWPQDLEHMEEGGAIAGADPDMVSDKAKERGRSQQGTLGSGNHFLEVQYVEEIYDEAAANVFGLFKNQVTVMIHSGSRGLGHQVCTDHLVFLEKAVGKYGIVLPDRQLACAPIDSPEGKNYLGAMRAAANFAWGNRQCMTHWAREVFMKVLDRSPKDLGMDLVYDVAHNIVKFEEHIVEGKKMKLAVHRKGATRAFPAGHPQVPEDYRSVGQPILIPGDMGRASYVLVGTEGAMEQTFGTTCHGAGRVMSRHAAIKAAKGRAINRELEDQGIFVRHSSRETLKEEMPEAYKDVSMVVEVCHRAGISRKVAKLRPMGVIKG